MNAVGMLSLIQKAIIVAPGKRNGGTTDRVISAAAGLLLGYNGIRNIKKGGIALLIPAGYLLLRGTNGFCALYNLFGYSTAEGTKPFEFEKTLTIHRNKVELYNFWRCLENLPLIMKHIKNVEKTSEGKYRWEAEFNNQIFKWNAEIIEDVPNERISWIAIDAYDVRNSGTVEFYDAPKNKGTELRVTMQYKAAKSKLGRVVARFLDPFFTQMVKDDLKRFKHMMESEEFTFEKQSSSKMKMK
jgi:uncharacterized membrane protein